MGLVISRAERALGFEFLLVFHVYQLKPQPFENILVKLARLPLGDDGAGLVL
jgi:hypothetical protein